jgi:hypothetical protein
MQWNSSSVGFIDMFYLDLVAKCKFIPQKPGNWSRSVLQLIFLKQPNRCFRLYRRLHLCGQLSKATHCIIQSFIAVQYNSRVSHPSIVTEISLFMVRERVDPQEMQELTTKCKKKAEDSTSKVKPQY